MARERAPEISLARATVMPEEVEIDSWVVGRESRGPVLCSCQFKSYRRARRMASTASASVRPLERFARGDLAALPARAGTRTEPCPNHPAPAGEVVAGSMMMKLPGSRDVAERCRSQRPRDVETDAEGQICSAAKRGRSIQHRHGVLLQHITCDSDLLWIFLLCSRATLSHSTRCQADPRWQNGTGRPPRMSPRLMSNLVLQHQRGPTSARKRRRNSPIEVPMQLDRGGTHARPPTVTESPECDHPDGICPPNTRQSRCGRSTILPREAERLCQVTSTSLVFRCARSGRALVPHGVAIAARGDVSQPGARSSESPGSSRRADLRESRRCRRRYRDRNSIRSILFTATTNWRDAEEKGKREWPRGRLLHALPGRRPEDRELRGRCARSPVLRVYCSCQGGRRDGTYGGL